MAESDGNEVREALLKHYAQMREELLAVIDGLSDEQMSHPSIDGWSVKDHLAHLSLWDEIRASEIERVSAGHEAAWSHIAGEQTEEFNALIHGMRKDLSVEQVRWELETSRQRVLDAITNAGPRGLDGSLYKEAGLMSTHEAMHTGWIKRWREQSGI